MKRARRTLAATVTLAVASMTLTGCFEEPSAHEAVRDFLVGWQSADYDLAATRTDGDPAVVAKALDDVRRDLDAASFRFRITGVSRTGEESVASFRAEVDLGENSPLWAYDSKLPLRLVDGLWKVRWSPSVLHPQLREGQRFAVDTDPAGRQPVEDRSGDALQEDALLYVAGVTPAQVGADAEKFCEQLAAVTGFAQDRLLSRVRSAPPTSWVPLVTFGRTKYLQLKSKLDAIPGIKVDTQKHPVAPAAPKGIVGRVSALTPETTQKLGGPQRAGDSVGQSGLQKAYQDHLTGSTRTSVVTLDVKTGEQVAELKRWPGRSNGSVRTTLDAGIQAAAETALSGTKGAAMVAVDAPTGEIRAVGSSADMDQVGDALAGRFPAGTAFSIVAADALIKSGVSPRQRLACPAQRSVGGAVFEQPGLASGAATFTTNFARGCVTALASLARRVSGDELAKSAAAFGVGSPWKLPLKSFSGKMPKLDGDAAKAKTIAGQNVEMSPLSMALVAAAVADGTWRPPTLVTKPQSPDPAAETLPTTPPLARQLDPAVRATLQAMMKAGVRSGTAGAAQAPGGQVYGVTARVAGEKNLSWFVGWQGDVAIAVLAEDADPAVYAGRFFGAIRNSR
ncbi:penicillin-binding transpeptidase domain-containing protein [Nonomuraea sp. NPDC046570]|uniref:penicillin-binding transpeptidase domain-containing protein n=1 Tax=Nonomuraea sp. NPDC046570 TaxID=3155255 RepID=UPI0033FA6440